jgi:large subunit ribosomal protein L13
MAWKKQIGIPKIERDRHIIDADGKVVGRLATEIARLLIGKHKPTYTPHIDGGDFVEVQNVSKMKLTGNKWEQKEHIRTSGRPGGLKRVTMKKLKEEHPEKVLEHAVRYMLPKNKQQTARMKRLKITA